MKLTALTSDQRTQLAALKTAAHSAQATATAAHRAFHAAAYAIAGTPAAKQSTTPIHLSDDGAYLIS